MRLFYSIVCTNLVATQELEKFRNAMKKKEFRDLLVDYAKEIQDPENKKVRLSLERCLFVLWITLLMYVHIVSPCLFCPPIVLVVATAN